MISLFLGACVPGNNDYSGYANIPAEGWRYAKPLSFDVTHGDSIATGALCLMLRHSDQYEYSNLWVEVEYTDAKTGLRRDTVNIRLADKYGRWLGKGNATDFQVADTINRRLTHAKGSQVKVRHIMRVDTLQGIDLVGVAFTAD